MLIFFLTFSLSILLFHSIVLLSCNILELYIHSEYHTGNGNYLFLESGNGATTIKKSNPVWKQRIFVLSVLCLLFYCNQKDGLERILLSLLTISKCTLAVSYYPTKNIYLLSYWLLAFDFSLFEFILNCVFGTCYLSILFLFSSFGLFLSSHANENEKMIFHASIFISCFIALFYK